MPPAEGPGRRRTDPFSVCPRGKGPLTERSPLFLLAAPWAVYLIWSWSHYSFRLFLSPATLLSLRGGPFEEDEVHCRLSLRWRAAGRPGAGETQDRVAAGRAVGGMQWVSGAVAGEGAGTRRSGTVRDPAAGCCGRERPGILPGPVDVYYTPVRGRCRLTWPHLWTWVSLVS